MAAGATHLDALLFRKGQAGPQHLHEAELQELRAVHQVSWARLHVHTTGMRVQRLSVVACRQ